MTLYHPRALADKLEGIVPELQRWSHRASMALEKAHIQQKRIEDRHRETGYSVQMHGQQLVVDQEAVRHDEELLQACDRNCQETLAQAQQTASVAQSILKETQTTYNRMQQALRSAQEALAQAEQALEQATINVEKQMVEFAKASTGGNQDDKGVANHGLSMAKKAQSQASSATRTASVHVANCTKALTLASQALQLAGVADQQAQAGLKACEDSVEFIRAAARALELGQQELGKEDGVVKAASGALQCAALITQESSMQLVEARSHEQPAQQHSTDTLRILQIKIGLLMVMNRPELDNFSDPMVAALQLTTDTNRGGLPQILNLRLARLRTKLEKIEGLKPQQWSRLSLAERAEVLQQAHNAVAAAYHFKSIPVLVLPLLPYERGVFSHTKGLIIINSKLVVGNNNVQPLQTLMHESRHAYQWHSIKRFRQGALFFSDADWELAREWSENADDYKSPEKYGLREYLQQPVEADARNFAQTAIKLLFGE